MDIPLSALLILWCLSDIISLDYEYAINNKNKKPVNYSSNNNEQRKLLEITFGITWQVTKQIYQ